MKFLKVLALACLATLAAASVALPTAKAQTTPKPAVRILDKEGLTKLLAMAGDTVYVVNFWATWCAPCVEELPWFDAATVKYGAKPVRVILVTLDSKKKLESTVLPFMKKQAIKSEVMLLSAGDPNGWINSVSQEWSGAIPATIIWRGGRPGTFRFTEGQMEEAELHRAIDERLGETNLSPR